MNEDKILITLSNLEHKLDVLIVRMNTLSKLILKDKSIAKDIYSSCMSDDQLDIIEKIETEAASKNNCECC